MRRDTVSVQPNGHAVLRFRSDNPGVWLFHCHIEWHVASGLIATFIEAPLELQKTLSIPDAHYDLCSRNHPPINVSGNAAGNRIDYLNLKGEPSPPAALPKGFTTKGVVAIIISALNALVMVAAIAWYGLYQAEGNDSGASDANEANGVDDGRPSEERPLLAEPDSR
jgi:iron transport multicopper oxidase